MVQTHPRVPPVELLHVTSVQHAGDYKLRLRFSDGVEGLVDLRDHLKPDVFEPLRDTAFFARAYLQDGYTVAWSKDLDFAPEFLYDHLEVTGSTGTLQGARVYYWKVQGWNTNGAQGQYSSTYSFTTR